MRNAWTRRTSLLAVASVFVLAAFACRGSPPCEDDDDLQTDASRGCAPTDAVADLAYVAYDAGGGGEADAAADGPAQDGPGRIVDASRVVPTP